MEASGLDPEPASRAESPLPTSSTFSTTIRSTSATTTSSSTTSSSSSSSSSSSPFTPALTESWTRPETCAYTYDADNPAPPGNGPTAYLDWAIDEGTSTFSCYPPGMFESGNSGTFSPASCPYSWYTVDNPDTSEPVEKSVTTTRTCCSRSFTLRDGFCQKAIPTVLATPVTYLPAESTVSYMTKLTVYLVNATVAHHPIVILFQEKDQEVLGLLDDELANSDRTSSSTGLSLGTRIGLGIGVAAAVSIIVGLAFYLLRRRRRKAHPEKGLPFAVRSLPPRRDDLCRSMSSTSASSDGSIPARRRDPDPPPAYEPSPRQLTPTEGSLEPEGADAEPGEELRVLRVKQEAIQRRIQELETGGDERG